MNNQSDKPRILIVDDAPENIKLLGQALKSEYQITFATNGESGLKKALSEGACDLILLDIMMAGMDGYEVCRRLKADKRTQHIPVIFITAKNDEADETRGLEIGAVDYITKPFRMGIVKARVKTHIRLKQLLDMLSDLSSLDGLTGIPNRRRFDEMLAIEWRRSIRDASPLSLIMIDIDCFKAYNDNYGHIAGDDSLRKVAAALTEVVRRPMDFVARYGGEEFAAILPRTGIEGASHVAESMRRKIESLNIPHSYSPFSSHVTISAGTASIIPLSTISPSYLIKGADNALYLAKHQGRNRINSLDLNKK